MKPKLHFLCLDDERDSVASLVKTLNRASKDYHISLNDPVQFPEQIKCIIASDSKSEIDGLLLDLRLDQFVSGDNNAVNYRAGALAQEIRTLATEKKLSAFPICLWSMDFRLSKSFNKDDTVHDLFDLIILKDELPDNAKEISARLISIAHGYQLIEEHLKSAKTFHELLSIERNSTELDPRIGEEFSHKLRSFPVHNYVRYLFKQMLDVPGPLVDEDILWARLGIDIEKSADLPQIEKQIAKNCCYQGPFGDVWKRWWWHRVEKWLSNLAGGSFAMASLPAPQRVQFLQDKLHLKRLVAAKPIDDSYGSYFWTKCNVLKRPLDPMDGFVIASTGKLPWQEKEYLSREAALNRSKYNVRIDLDSLENERLRTYKTRKHG